MRRVLLLPLLVFLLCFKVIAQQQDVVVLNDEHQSIDISPYFSYWIDESGTASIQDVMQADHRGQFRKHEKKVINLGFFAKPVWLKVQVSNQAIHIREWLLEFNYPLLDSVTLYQQDESGRWLSETIGDQVPFKRRKIHFRNPTFPVRMYDNSRVYTIYVRVKTSSSMQLPAKLYTSNTFQEYTIKSDLAFGFFYGCMLVMLFYNLLLFAALRNLNYAYYCVYVLGYTLAQAGLQGHGFQYLWPNSLFWTNVSIPVLISLGLLGATLFANRFLYTKRYAPKMRIALWVLFGINALDIILSFLLPYQIMIKPVVLSIIVDSVVIIAAGIVVYRAGNKAAQYFIIAWLAFLLGLIATASEAFGILPRTFIFHYGHLFGAVIEVVFLSLALADRINVIRKQREEAQARALAMAQENERIIREQNIILEQKVRERTAELQQKQEEILTQNEELQQQREEILAQRDFIERQNQELQAINEHLNKSIQYGDRIQRAMLPSKEEILEHVRDFFVIYLPRDVVSGDFYWFSEQDGHLFFAAVDCTGHGVPGAFMSMIGNTLLDEIINEKHIYNPAFVLESLNDAVFKALRQDETGNADGMDVALCRIDKIDDERFELTFAGARRPAYIIKDGALVELKGNRRGIGGSMSQQLEQFENHQLILHVNDCIYIGSDGFTDAANPEREKFGTKRLKTLLQLYYKEPMERQRQYLIEELENFTKGTPMRDDVLLMGIRL
jgi:serine phosphatase RsbU (regulator of sigma subunit)